MLQKSTLENVKEILSTSYENFHSSEIIIREQLGLIFINDDELTNIVYPSIPIRDKSEFQLVNKYVELINYIFGLPKNNRNNIYSKKNDSIDDNKLKEIINQIIKKIDNITCIKSQIDTENKNNIRII